MPPYVWRLHDPHTNRGAHCSTVGFACDSTPDRVASINVSDYGAVSFACVRNLDFCSDHNAQQGPDQLRAVGCPDQGTK